MPSFQDHPSSFQVRQPRIGLRWALIGTLTIGGAIAVAGFGGARTSPVPIQTLVETVTVAGLDLQLHTLTKDSLRLYRSGTSRASDNADALLGRLGVNDPAAAAFMRSHPVVRESLLGKSARMLNAEVDDDNHLIQLTARWATDSSETFERLVIEKVQDQWVAHRDAGAYKTSIRLSGGSIQTSLFAATDEARIPDNVAVQLADIFSGDIDFHRALRKGDHFTVMYESLEADGEALKTGKVLSAEFVNKGHAYQAMWFRESEQKPGGYYNLQGESLRRTYLASPLAFSRVSSGFNMRFHPILQTWRAHLGVDYAAAQGTPVRSVGMGVVESAGTMGGYGQAVVIRHNHGHSTLYGHLSKLMVKRGQSVTQGQTIGLVGATGWATGPHLHFEFRVQGVHKDPALLARHSESVPVAPQARAEFLRQADRVAKQLASAAVAFVDTP